MATKGFNARLILELLNDTGEAPANSLDETVSVTGFKASLVRQIELAADASDEEVTVDAAGWAAAVVVSKDYGFSVRLVGGETLVGPVRFWAVGGDDEDVAAVSDQLLLTGNGTNPCNIEIWAVVALT